MQILITILVTFFAGMGAGLGTGFAGMSAAAVISPMLITFLGMDPYMAVGIALSSDVLASAVSAYTYAKNKNIDIKNGLIMMGSVLVFTVVGSYVSSLVPSATMGNFSVFMTFLLGIKFIVRPVMTTKEAMQGVSAQKRAVQSVVCGVLIGFICGFIGAGGGMMMLLILTSVLGYELKTAVGTSVFIMTFTALTGAVSHFMIGGTPDWLVWGLCVVFTLLWARIAAVFANKATPKTLNRATGVVLVVLALIFLISGGPVLGAVCLLLSLTAYYELIKACHVEKDGKFTLLEIMGGCGIVLYGAAMMLSKNFLWGIGAIVLMFLAVMFVYVFHFPKYHADQVMTVFFCAFYPGVLFPFIYLTRELSWGKYLVWLIFISSWICDTCAYLTGMAIGKHKLAPVLSPKKSIEGAIGGVVGSALVGALFAWLFLIPETGSDAMIWVVALISAAGAVISQVGDLSASAIKRNHDIKDYGKIIPGHGGIMDRFDSVLFTAPVIYFLSVILLGAVH